MRPQPSLGGGADLLTVTAHIAKEEDVNALFDQVTGALSDR